MCAVCCGDHKVQVAALLWRGIVTCVSAHRQATMDWESQDDGYVAALLVEDGAKDLAVGSPVLVFVEDQARLSTAETPVSTPPWLPR